MRAIDCPRGLSYAPLLRVPVSWKGLEVYLLSPPFVPSCCKGFVSALEVFRMSPLFVLAGFGECLDDYHISFASAVAMRVLIALKISRVPPRFVFL